MHRLEGRTLVASWLLLSAVTTAAILARKSAAIASHAAAWRAAAGPIVIVLASLISAALLMRSNNGRRAGWILAGAIAIAQVLSVSVGPLAYRLVAGPFVSIAVAPQLALHAGTDARLLLIIGAGNHVPDGMAMNIVAFVLLALVVASVRDDALIVRTRNDAF